MSVQSLNGDSYQGAQVGANVQSQVGTQPARRRAREPAARALRRLGASAPCPERASGANAEAEPDPQPNRTKHTQLLCVQYRGCEDGVLLGTHCSELKVITIWNTIEMVAI